MAVNENLYSWILKTYGMGAAEWYRSNPTKPSGANPFLPKGAYVPLAQKNAPGAKGPRGETLASVSPDIIEETIIEPASKAPAETEDQKFERYYNQAKQQFAESQKGRPSLAPGEIAAYGQKNMYFIPDWGEYGGYVTKENLGFSPSSALYKRYEDAIAQMPLRWADDPLRMGASARGSGASEEGARRVSEYNEDSAARQKAFQDIYQTPLSQLQYKDWSEAQKQNISLEQYRADVAKLGLEIPLVSGPGGYFVRGATPEDYEVQTYGAENVGREDYRQQRANSAIAKNFEILQQQAKSGNQDSQTFLNQYTAQEKAPATPEIGPRGERVAPARGPRGEDMDKLASIFPPAMTQGELYRAIQEYSRPDGPAKGSELRDLQREWIERQKKLKGAEAPTQTPNQKDNNFDKPSSAFDEQKALIAAQAAGAYRQRGDVEDPFRSAAFG